jgi:hypothetical protein
MNQCAEPLFGTAGTAKRFTLIEPAIPISIRWDGGSKQTGLARGCYG